MGKTVSAIIPVYNEQKTVNAVVKALLNSPLIDEVICINDCSKDKSLEVLKKYNEKIKLIDFAKNQGKGAALSAGIKKAKSEIVAFFDSDLFNLSDKHIRTLLNPILESKTRVVLGFPQKDSENNTFFCQLTGERVYFRDDLLPCLEKMQRSRLGVETYLNHYFPEDKQLIIPLKGLIHPKKYEKVSLTQATKDYIKEAIEIAQEIGKREGLLPQDYRKIKNLLKIGTYKELIVKINKISNTEVREFLKKYIIKYAGLAKKTLQDFLKE